MAGIQAAARSGPEDRRMHRWGARDNSLRQMLAISVRMRLTSVVTLLVPRAGRYWC